MTSAIEEGQPAPEAGPSGLPEAGPSGRAELISPHSKGYAKCTAAGPQRRAPALISNSVRQSDEEKAKEICDQYREFFHFVKLDSKLIHKHSLGLKQHGAGRETGD